MSTLRDLGDGGIEITSPANICPACGKQAVNPFRSETHCPDCARPVPVPLVFAAVDEDPASAGATACGEAALWLLNHEVSPSDVLSTLVNVTVGGPLEMFPYGYTLTLLVQVPRHRVQDLTTAATPVQTVESVREMADTLSRPRTTPPTTNQPTFLPLN